MPIAAINHIEIDDCGIARIAGTRLKVHILMSIMNVNKLNAEGLMESYPSLTPAQVYAALAYYHDHKAEIDQHNQECVEKSIELQRESERRHPELHRRLREAQERSGQDESENRTTG